MLILAPMAGVTDLAFRSIVKNFGCDLVVSEMVSAQGLLYNSKKSDELLKTDTRERPYAVQLFGHDPAIMAKAASRIVHQYEPDMLDLNMGCPTPKIVKNGDGAALLRNPQLVADITRAVVDAVSIPVTVKIRLGWDSDSINCIDVAKRVEQAGASWLTVHARTREQLYAGKADWEWIKRIKQTVAMPIVGNGDIFTPQDAADKLELTGCDHIMVGRGALGDPWLFRRIARYLDTGELLPAPTLGEKVSMALTHLRSKMQYRSESGAVREMRSHLAWYLKNVPHSSQIRASFNQATSYNEVMTLLYGLL